MALHIRLPDAPNHQAGQCSWDILSFLHLIGSDAFLNRRNPYG